MATEYWMKFTLVRAQGRQARDAQARSIQAQSTQANGAQVNRANNSHVAIRWEEMKG